jgi:hypothetical protein
MSVRTQPLPRRFGAHPDISGIASAGTIRNAGDLDTLSVKIDDQFSMFPASTPESCTRWAMVDLMYEDPASDRRRTTYDDI